MAEDQGYDFQILNAVMEVNGMQRRVLAEKIKRFFNNNLQGKTIAIWGLAFKPNTDDIREAPAIYIIESLLQAGAKVQAFDPEAMGNFGALFEGRITLVNDQYDVLDKADALAIVTEWSVFRAPDFEDMKKRMNHPAIFDGRNLYDLDHMQQEGFYYESIGREVTKVRV